MKKLTLLLLLLPLLFSCNDEEEEKTKDEIRNERIDQLIKDTYAGAYSYMANFRDHEALFVHIKDTEIYKHTESNLRETKELLQKAIEEDNRPDIWRHEEWIERYEEILAGFEQKRTIPIYVVTYDVTLDGSLVAMQTYINKDFEIIGSIDLSYIK